MTSSSCIEDLNLREKFLSNRSTSETTAGTISAKHKEQLAVNDVKWSHGEWSTAIATAAANGQIIIYDINKNKAGVEIIRLHGHERQVHRLGFNPHRGSLLLSGSQDATTKLWDLRAFTKETSAMSYYTKSTYHAGYLDAVRDLQWSPTNGVEFAIGTDKGSIQLWDIRQTKSPVLRVNAHEQTCNSIRWHPDGKHVASGSSDKTVKIWDLSSPDNRMKPMWQLRMPHAAMHVRWRPASWVPGGDGPGERHCTQLAVSYDKEDPRIHVWDLRRPSIPVGLLSRCETSPAALLWHSEDLLWSVDAAGLFVQTDVRFARETVAGYNVNPLDVGPDGQFLFACMKRRGKRSSLEDVTDASSIIKDHEASRAGQASEGQGIMNVTHEETPRLSQAAFKNRRGKPQNPVKLARSMDTTPPSAEASPGPEDPVLPLDQSLQKRYMYVHPQKMGVGHVPGLVDTDAFQFMARHYIAPTAVMSGKQGYNLHLILSKVCKHNAGVAKFVGQYRLAQTWKILAKAVEMELGKRAERNCQSRMAAMESEDAQEQSLTPRAPSSPANSGSFDHRHPTKTGVPISAQSGSHLLKSPTHIKLSTQATSHDPSPDKGLAEMDRQITGRQEAIRDYRAYPRSILNFDEPFSSAEDGHSSAMNSNETDEAEGAMEFDDDEVKMMEAFHLPDSTDGFLVSYAGKHGSSEAVSDRTMPPAECAILGQHIINKDDVHPLKKWVAPSSSDQGKDHHSYIESDFRPSQHEIDAGLDSPPWTATAMFLPLIDFHCNISDAQFSTYLILHLAPWLSVSFPPMRALRIILAYHHQLTQLELHNEASELRTYCQSDFPSIADLGREDITIVGPWCTECRKVSKATQEGYCKRCKTYWAECSICYGNGAFLESRSTTQDTVKFPRAINPAANDELWAWCTRCGHGGHAGCLRGFWKDSDDGACPTIGCSCDCMPGKRREEIHAELEADWTKKPGAAAAAAATQAAGKGNLQLQLLLQQKSSSGLQATPEASGRRASGAKKSVKFAMERDE